MANIKFGRLSNYKGYDYYDVVIGDRIEIDLATHNVTYYPSNGGARLHEISKCL